MKQNGKAIYEYDPSAKEEFQMIANSRIQALMRW